MPLLKEVLFNSVAEAVQKGDLKIKRIVEEGNSLIIVISENVVLPDVEAKPEPKKQVAQTHKSRPSRSKRKLHRSPKARKQLQERVLGHLMQTKPLSTKEIGDLIYMDRSTAQVVLKELEKQGLVREVTGGKRYWKWIKVVEEQESASDKQSRFLRFRAGQEETIKG